MRCLYIIFFSFSFFNVFAQKIEVTYLENRQLPLGKSYSELNSFDKIKYKQNIFAFTLTYADGYSAYINNDFSTIFDLYFESENTKTKLLSEDDQEITFVGTTKYDPNAYKIFEKKIYKDYLAKKTYMDLSELQKVEDFFIDWDWQITDIEKVIAGYTCKKAISNFKGYSFEAWFTDEIPISIGPEKFEGLPGLILFAKLGEIEIIATSIKFLDQTPEIEMPKFSGKVFTFDELFSPVKPTLEKFREKEFKPILLNSDGTKSSIKTVTPIN